MKSLVKTILIILIGMSFNELKGQETADQFAGSWLGTLDVGEVQLRIIFNLSLNSDGHYKATLDSPDQGAAGVPLGEVKLYADSIRIDAPSIYGYYQGKIVTPTTIEGQWSQAGRTFELNLEKQDTIFVLNRPQEPRPPFPYQEEEVTFENKVQHFSLQGTLTIPEGEGPFPAVVLVTGSGSQNRDEEIFGHKPFRLIADHLTRAGIMVLRYDDRGFGSSGGSNIGATSLDYALDARSAIEFLFSQPLADPSSVGVIGHSEGGMIAFQLASQYQDIAFIITLAGPGIDGKDILLDQSEYINRLSGVDKTVREDNRIVMTRVYDLMINNESYNSWVEETKEFITDYYSGSPRSSYSEGDLETIKSNLLGSIPESVYPWMRYFIRWDPSGLFATINCPVLALNGEKDCQVLAEKNIYAIREGLHAAGNTRSTTMILPGLNHLFQHCRTGLPNEYSTIEETFDPAVLDIISSWILKQYKQRD
jgi:pimeloyl-ACP methyl ester carboxylesterase